MRPNKPETNTRPLDPSIYDATLNSEVLSFMKSSTGIQDDGELKAHVLDIQKKAYAVRMTHDQQGQDSDAVLLTFVLRRSILIHA